MRAEEFNKRKAEIFLMKIQINSYCVQSTKYNQELNQTYYDKKQSLLKLNQRQSKLDKLLKLIS